MNKNIKKCSFVDELDWLSNMYECSIILDDSIDNLQSIFPQFKLDGLLYGSSEHIYQSLKSTNDTDKELIRKAKNPKMSKNLGSKVFSRMDWESVKIDAMRLALYLKFHQNPYLIEKLLKTENEPIVEVNWWNDTFWGGCIIKVVKVKIG